MKLRRTMSARAYLLLLLLGGILALSLVGFGMLQSMRNVRIAAEHDRDHSAETELDAALSKVSVDARRMAATLARWDEVYQQIKRPEYYGYWRDQRLQEIGRFPAYVQGVELYSSNGTILASDPGTLMPQKLTGTAEFVQVHDGQAFLFEFVPVASRNRPGATDGYVGVQISLLDAVRDMNRFVNIDPTSLTVKPADVASLAAARAASLFSYKTVASPVDSELSSLMAETMLRLVVVFSLLGLALTWLVTRVFTRPLRALSNHLDALRQGRRSPLGNEAAGVLPVQELERVRHSLNSYQRELDTTYRRLDAQKEELWSMAHVDALTGVHNRRAYELDWRKVSDVTENRRLDIAFLLFDCDFFKAINDTYGHATGDQVIQGIAHALQSALRKGDRLYRLGGDEFAAILLSADAEEADRVARRCQEAVRLYPFRRAGVREPVRISVGIANARGTDEAALESLQRHADLAMYKAKRTSGDRIVHHSPELGRGVASVLSSRVVHAVMAALENGRNLCMYYQPVVQLSDGAISHFEALVRIRDANGEIGADEIMGLIRRRSLELELDAAVLRQVAADLARGLLPPNTGVAVNLSGASVATPELYSRLQPLTSVAAGIELILEITETDLITQFQLVSENLTRLRMEGIKVALDDFGSGYSSIRYLANMPVDTVKFDISMIRDLEANPRSRGIVEHTARLVLDAGYELIAEGIESQQALEIVRGLGFTHGQGHVLGRPEPLDATCQQQLRRDITQ